MLRWQRIIKWLAALLTVAVLAGAVVAGRYVYRKGFTKKWRLFVIAEFHQRGVEIDFQKLTLDPFHGLQARRVKIFDSPQRTALLASVDKVVLDINYANLIRGRPFLEAVDLSQADLAIPLDPAQPRGDKARIDNLNARILFPPGQVYISHASASIYQLDLSVRGRLLNPQAFQAKPGPPEDTTQRTELIRRVLDTLKKIDARGSRPRIAVNVTGDLAEPSGLLVDLALEAPLLELRNYRLESVRGTATYAAERITISRLSAVDHLGRLDARGSVDLAQKSAELELRSGLDLPDLAHAFNLTDAMDEIELNGPGEIRLAGSIKFGDKPQFLLTANARLNRLRVRGVELESVQTDAAWDGQRWYLRGLRVQHKTGELTGSALQDGRLVARLESSIDPTVALPFTTRKTREFLSDWKFIRTPDVIIRASGPSLLPEEIVLSGSLRLGRTIFRGQPIVAGAARFEVKAKAARYFNCRVERAEGVATGNFIYDFGRKRVVLDDCHSTLDPQAVAHWIAPDFPKHVAPYRFRRPPQVDLEGLVYYQGGEGTDLRLKINAPGGMDYTFLKKDLPISRISGLLRFTDHRLRMSEVQALLFGGEVMGEADIRLDRGPQPFAAALRAQGVDFAALTRLYFDYDSSTGKLDGDFAFSGVGDNARKLQGTGHLNVTNGNVFAIPCMGPVSGILNNIVPGMGISVAREASADLKMAEGVISVSDFTVAGRGFEMLGGGSFHFLDDSMKFDVRINAKGLPGVLLFPVSKLFEYTADGSISKPQWRPKNLRL